MAETVNISESIDIFDDDEDLWELDTDVKLALVVTLIIGFLLITKVINAAITLRRQRRQEVVEGLSPEQAEQRRVNAQRRINEAMQEDEHDCPICLAPAQFPVLTDCGHIFCCTCIIGYWQHSKAIVSPCDCAICRSTFHMLLPVRWPSRGDNEELNDKIHESNMKIDDYNRRFSNNRPPLDYIRDIPVLVPYLVRNFFNSDMFTLVYRVRIGFVFVCVIAYFIMPLDMVPESIYGVIGFLDDCVIGILVIGALIRWLRAFMADRGLAQE